MADVGMSKELQGKLAGLQCIGAADGAPAVQKVKYSDSSDTLPAVV